MEVAIATSLVQEQEQSGNSPHEIAGQNLEVVVVGFAEAFVLDGVAAAIVGVGQ